MTGNVFSVEEFSVYDGPGIRTTVFLKGCPLRCTWCHNPEGQNTKSEIVRSPNGCIGCGECMKTGSFTLDSIKKCPMNLLRVSGESISSNDLCERLMKNERILSNGGGVTFSGGEPLMQHEFVIDCIKRLKGRLHTAVQTSGFCTPDIFDKVLDVADYFLYDLKLADEQQHIKFTGCSNRNILRNFEKLAKSGVEFTARIPLIPGVTDTEENIIGIAKMLHYNNVDYVELLPYNKMAGGKYKMLLREYKPGFDETQEVNIRENIFERYNIKIKVM